MLDRLGPPGYRLVNAAGWLVLAVLLVVFAYAFSFSIT
jgi:hypothetical protein